MKRHNAKTTTSLMDLPFEILIDILRRLPVKSVCCIRCVSKTLSDIVYSPLFADLHTRFSIPTNSLAGEAPQLVLRHVVGAFYSGDPKTRTNVSALESLMYDDSQGKFTLSVSSEILSTSHKVYCSDVPFVFYDLIFFKQGCNTGNCFLINPLSGQVLRVPASNIIPTNFGEDLIFFEDAYGMGFNDTTSTGTYKIVRMSRFEVEPFSSDPNTYVVGQLLVLGTSSWREIPLHPFLHIASSWDKSVCAYGDAHWLFVEEADGHRKHIVSFDFKKEEFYLTPIPVKSSRMAHLHLITMGNSIAIVDTFFPSMKVEIWVMKDYDKKQWNREYIITHQMFGDVDFKFHRATCGEMEYGIYFIDQRGENLLFVDLRPFSMKCVTIPIRKKKCRRIISLKRSLISLKKFGDLVKESKSGAQSSDLLDFSKKYLWQVQRLMYT